MKTTLIYYFETTKMRLLNQKTITGVGENVKKLEPSLSYENRKWSTQLWESLAVLQYVNHRVTVSSRNLSPDT